MDCKLVAENAGRFVDGMTSAGEGIAIETHRRTCPKCAALIAEFELLGRLHARLGRLDPPEGMTGRIVDAACAAGRRSGIARAAFAAAAAAAVVLLGIGAGSFILSSYLDRVPEDGYAVYTGLEYLEVYPPSSIGEAIQLAAGGETNG